MHQLLILIFEVERKRVRTSSYSLAHSRSTNHLLAKTGIQKLDSGILHGWQEPRHLSYPCSLLPSALARIPCQSSGVQARQSNVGCTCVNRCLQHRLDRGFLCILKITWIDDRQGEVLSTFLNNV